MRLLLIILLFLCLAGCVGRQVERTTPIASRSDFDRRPIPQSANKKGVHLLLADTFHDWPVDVWRDHMTVAREVVGEWGYVTQLIRLDDLDPKRWQHFMDLCAELHLTPLIRIATTAEPDIGGWSAPPRDADLTYATVAAEYAAFFATLQWPTNQHYLLVGNEPNHGNEWGGTPDPSAYARFLIDMADALHQADPNAIVLNAGFDTFAPNTNGQPFLNGPPLLDAESFLNEMVIAQPNVFTYIDAWASHSYPLGSFTDPPWLQAFQVDHVNGATLSPDHIAPPTGTHNRGINGYEWELFKLRSLGVDQLPVFITETGWRVEAATEYVASEFLTLAMVGDGVVDGEEVWQAWQFDERVVAVTPFAFNGDPERWHHSNWVTFRADGTIASKRVLAETWERISPTP